MKYSQAGLRPYEALRNAIVIQAAADYRRALRAQKRKPNSYIHGSVKADCERFFMSDWFKAICNVSGEMIMKEIQKEEGVYEG